MIADLALAMKSCELLMIKFLEIFLGKMGILSIIPAFFKTGGGRDCKNTERQQI
jgi:hypothetical protein